MNIRNFAQICKLIAEGKDASHLLPRNMHSSIHVANMARDQSVLPLWASAISAKNEKSARSVDAVVQTSVNYLMTNMRIKAQLLEIDKHLKNTDIKPILIKGAVQLFEGLYPTIGLRYMADIDILVADAKFGVALREMGYVPKNPAFSDNLDESGNPVLKIGQRHLTPVIRPQDCVTIEPHLLAVNPMYLSLLPSDLVSTAVPLPGCHALLRPNNQNNLIINLIHTLKHDRDTLDGGLLVRGLVECELIYERLSHFEQVAVATHFADTGWESMWKSWRDLADWLFRYDEAAIKRSWASFYLINEFKLRARGYRTVFVIAVINRILAYSKLRYWTSGGAMRDSSRIFAGDFWVRLFEKFSKALRG